MAHSHRPTLFHNISRSQLARDISSHVVEPACSGREINFDAKLRDDLLEHTFPQAANFANLLGEISTLDDASPLSDSQQKLLRHGLDITAGIIRIVEDTREQAIKLEKPGGVPSHLAGTTIHKIISFSSRPDYKPEETDWNIPRDKKVEDSITLSNLKAIESMLNGLAIKCGIELPPKRPDRAR